MARSDLSVAFREHLYGCSVFQYHSALLRGHFEAVSFVFVSLYFMKTILDHAQHQHSLGGGIGSHEIVAEKPFAHSLYHSCCVYHAKPGKRLTLSRVIQRTCHAVTSTSCYSPRGATRFALLSCLSSGHSRWRSLLSVNRIIAPPAIEG